ncbi:TrbC/VirB2 family protein [Rickettsiella endosymbiont of Miltochrista miniata]|uniref:TrbC/VirB2 family protein n=1 Tax=Rickettsiella endosymbiont of Miltochrista miniata TaxID=3066239 RepID=UPI00313AFAF6
MFYSNKNMQYGSHKKIFQFTNFITFLFLSSQLCWAGGGDTPVNQGLHYFIDALLGATGLSIATLAIMGVGLLCAGHYVEWKYFFYTLLGISFLFGAPAIALAIRSLFS